MYILSVRIDKEFDLVGINYRHKGRAYLQEAVLFLISKDKNTSEAIIAQIAENNKNSYGSVIRAMQTAINGAWKNSAIEDLLTHFTAPVSVRTGVPTPTDFINFYADKIRKSM